MTEPVNSSEWTYRIIKVGGAALTQKDTFEMLNDANISHFICCIKKMRAEDEQQKRKIGTILIHGAGSYGHYQAKEYSIAQGNTSEDGFDHVGFSKTRQSVRKLLSVLEGKFLTENIPVCPVSPFPSWTLNNKQVVESNWEQIRKLTHMGFIPLLHGDAVIDHKQGYAILSGDLIANYLCKQLKPKYVTFLTDVLGVYDKPPRDNHDASLIENITVERDPDGSVRTRHDFSTSQPEFDVTGGIRGKIDRSIDMVAETGTEVLIAKAGTEYAIEACKGIKPQYGTRIYCQRPSLLN